ncbi:MAG: radical SAM protein [Chloroflexi bacterium]|nr:radical SAM protein [Chloroflexota bacterium]
MLNVVLLSTYELGRQPFGLASPAAWLEEIGARVTCLDLAVQRLDKEVIAQAGLIAFYVPMHTATRLAATTIKQVRRLNPQAHICFYGLYAPMNAAYLQKLGAGTILGGEFEEGLANLAQRLANGNPASAPEEHVSISLARQNFHVPDRRGLPDLAQYAYLDRGDGKRKTVGYTEASRGCKHLCRHCPVVPVYQGQFRIVQREVVLEDIRRQVAAGARHITFGDPDFFNGPGHAIPLVQALHQEWPDLTYDVTIKVEHLLKHQAFLPILRDTGCAFVTSAVEAVDDRILEIFDKRHSREDFIRLAGVFRELGLHLNPTFVTFSPWISPAGYLDLLRLIRELDLVDHIAPIQYAIRLLIPAGSKLMELPEVQQLVGDFDEAALCYPWIHPDPRMDRLHAEVLRIVQEMQAGRASRREIFSKIWELASTAEGVPTSDEAFSAITLKATPQTPIPFLSEPWYC